MLGARPILAALGTGLAPAAARLARSGRHGPEPGGVNGFGGKTMEGINILAVLVAALSSFLLGGIWYGPLFKQAWCREAGVDPDPAKGRHPAKVFGGAFVFALVSAFAFARLLGPAPELAQALAMGVTVGSCFVAASFAINYLFANRSLLLWLIDGGYHVLQFLAYGLVLGLWH